MHSLSLVCVCVCGVSFNYLIKLKNVNSKKMNYFLWVNSLYTPFSSPLFFNMLLILVLAETYFVVFYNQSGVL